MMYLGRLHRALCCWLAAALLCSGCGTAEETERTSAENKQYTEYITLMHSESDTEEFQEYIRQAEEELQIGIRLVQTPGNADNRHARIATILSSGDSSVDIIGINDEMMSEFRKKGYLEPLGEDVLPQEILDCYPQDYLKTIAMENGKMYSVPYMLDIMLYCVNQDLLEQAGLQEVRTQKDFERLLDYYSGGNAIFGYGGAWEESYAYNEISQFVNLFGGDYSSWSDPGSGKAVKYLHDMVQNQEVAEGILLDQHEQMEQKFLFGQYASMFLYSGSVNLLMKSESYRQMHVAALPEFVSRTTNIATWQYVLNRASEHKEAAKRFLAYAAGKKGCMSYYENMDCLPARLDLIQSEKFDFPDMDIIREYVKSVELKPRYFTESSMEGIRDMGDLFQKYVTDEISLDEFCRKAQKIVEGEQKK